MDSHVIAAYERQWANDLQSDAAVLLHRAHRRGVMDPDDAERLTALQHLAAETCPDLLDVLEHMLRDALDQT